MTDPLDLDAIEDRAGEDRVLEDIRDLIAEVRRLRARPADTSADHAANARIRALETTVRDFQRTAAHLRRTSTGWPPVNTSPEALGALLIVLDESTMTLDPRPPAAEPSDRAWLDSTPWDDDPTSRAAEDPTP